MNRKQRRAEVRLHRRRAKWVARSLGCTCPAELKLSPIDGRPVWAERPDSDRKVYLTHHRPDCPIWVTYHDSPEWVTIARHDPECSRDAS